MHARTHERVRTCSCRASSISGAPPDARHRASRVKALNAFTALLMARSTSSKKPCVGMEHHYQRDEQGWAPVDVGVPACSFFQFPHRRDQPHGPHSSACLLHGRRHPPLL